MEAQPWRQAEAEAAAALVGSPKPQAKVAAQAPSLAGLGVAGLAGLVVWASWAGLAGWLAGLVGWLQYI